MIDVDKLGARIIFDFGDGSVFVSESILLGLIVAVILAVLGIWLGSNLKTVPKGKQVFAEFIVEKIYQLTEESLGKENSHFAPYIGTIFGFIFLGSSLGTFGLRPITADLNVTFSLSALTFLLIQLSSTKRLGLRGRLKEMCEPYPFMFPLKVLEEMTLPVSLGLRLFGNILGGVIVVELWMHFMTYLSNFLTTVPFLRAVLVLPLNGFFDMFEPAIQTYIFTMLTMVFLRSSLGGVAPKIKNKTY